LGFDISLKFEPWILNFSISFPGWLPAARCVIFRPMFDTIKSGITTATEKLTHLRRFL
jgi:hypothetical protein